ncbi:MAG: DUF924 domain-containing protein [Azonexus sp.]|jgi:uncharacterized protein (DUF924 family)|nr:DUF924 domain-containing protein [Betaproteobacteria bacterium]MBK8919031.1 DUF924 domain-containing protein [Betaproteobacteria bacterium]MBP6036700.1 DUF924 domain-containing protein [Azonexus sp.]MBP6905483.1 DUF924 domain-containing protein [Azonexus sp.]
MAAAGFRDVLAYWFGQPDDADFGKPRAVWFNKDAAADAEIRGRFRALHLWAHGGLLNAWDEQAESALALILVLDQFSRQIYRDQPKAFASDGKALALAEKALAACFDRALPPLQRAFFYFPFEHAESSVAQARAVALFEALAAEAPELASFADYARRHREVIARFGRFPHRNTLLGRANTPEEAEYLAQPGSGF